MKEAMLSKIVQESVEEMNSAIEQDFMFFNNNNPIEDSEWSLKDENREYLYKVVEKTKKELEERQKNSKSFVKYHLISSQISLLEAELERKKGIVITCVITETTPDGGQHIRVVKDDNYIWAIQEDVLYLEKELELIKKMV